LDPALLRTPLAALFATGLGESAYRWRLVEVFLRTGANDLSQDHYAGVYVLMESVKVGENRTDITPLRRTKIQEPEISGGYIFRSDKFSPTFQSFIADRHLFQVYRPRDPTPEQQSWLAQRLEAVVAALQSNDPELGYPAVIDTENWINTSLVNMVTANIDWPVFSTFYHLDRGDPLVRAGPIWDFDRSMGSRDTRDDDPRHWNPGGAPFIAHWWVHLFRHADFWQRYTDRWLEARQTVFSDETLNAHFDAFLDELAEAGPRNYERWGNLFTYRFGGWLGEVEHLREWLLDRFAWIDEQFPPPPSLATAAGLIDEAVTVAFKSPPPDSGTVYYTTDGSDPRGHDGLPSASAVRYEAPFPITADTRLKARVWSGRPWDWHLDPEDLTVPWSPLLEELFLVSRNPAHPPQLIAGGAPAAFHLPALFPEYQTLPPVISMAAAPEGSAHLDFIADHLVVDPLRPGDVTITVTVGATFEEPVTRTFNLLVYPAPHTLGERAYAFDQWSPHQPVGTFPPHMLFLQSDRSDPGLGEDLAFAYAIPPDDAFAPDDADFPYAATRRTRINGLGPKGISFINTGRERDLGGALLALDTRGVTASALSWEAETLHPNERSYALRLQYRVGTEGPFFDLTGPDNHPVEYIRSTGGDDGPVHLGPVALPAEALGQPYVQLLWRYYFMDGTSGPRAELRLGRIRVAASPAAPADRLAFAGNLPPAWQIGTPLPPLQVHATDANGFIDPAFSGEVTLAWLTPAGAATIAATTAANGIASFPAPATEGTPGPARLQAAAPGLPALESEEIRRVRTTGVWMPRYIQGGRDKAGNNHRRVPTAFRVRIDGLLPYSVYRYGNRVVDDRDPPGEIGAGNMIFVTGGESEWRSHRSSPRFRQGDFGDRHFTFATDATGSHTGWFVIEPSANDRFTPGNHVRLQIVLNDGGDGEDPLHLLTVEEPASVIRPGTGTDEASALVGSSRHHPRNFVLLHNDASGSGRPLAIVPIEPTGSVVDERYAAFYQALAADGIPRWGALLPNDLPAGLRLLETRSWSDGSLLAAEVFPGALPGTVDPDFGLAPLFLEPGDDWDPQSPLIAFAGESIHLRAAYTMEDPGSYQWFHNGQPIPGATGHVLHLPDISTADEGFYAVNIKGASLTQVEAVAQLTLRPLATMVNLSSRGQNLRGAGIMIAGFVLGEGAGRTLLLTGKGPSLADFGLTGLLPDPMLVLFDRHGQELLSNRSWTTHPDADLIASSGFGPSREEEAALLIELEANQPYTVHLRNPEGETGIGLVEIFDLDGIVGSEAGAALINLSIRGKIEQGGRVLIAGFVVDGSAEARRRVLLRGSGPSMAALGVANPLPDPILRVFDSNQNLLAENHAWQEADQAAAIEASGFAPEDEREAALLLTLPPGAYTVHLREAENQPGIGRIEIFTMP
ncbi:MAG: hypothetical protein EA425_13695, partial [Puniceicoccaceae bacterium]